MLRVLEASKGLMPTAWDMSSSSTHSDDMSMKAPNIDMTGARRSIMGSSQNLFQIVR